MIKYVLVFKCVIGNISVHFCCCDFLYAFKPAERTISAFMGAFLEEHFVV